MKITKKFISENKIITMMSLYPGKTREEVTKLLCDGLEKRMKPLLIAVFVASFIALILTIVGKKDEDAYFLHRNEMGETSKSIHISLENEGVSREYILQLNPVSMSEEEIDRLHLEVSEMLEMTILGDNHSMDEISENMKFPDFLEDYGVYLSWVTDNPWILSTSGEVNNHELSEPCSVEITARIYYGDSSRFFTRTVIVVPYSYTQEELIYKNAIDALNEKEKSERNEKIFEVPEFIGNVGVSVIKEKKKSVFVIVTMVGLMLLVYAYNNYFSSLSEKRKNRIHEAEEQYKNFVSRLYLLLSTGLSLRLSIRRIAEEYSNDNKKGLLADNLKVLVRELETGGNEVESYQHFGNRMESVKFQRLASILVQQTTKGVRNIGETLESEVREAYLSDIAGIKSKGEEVSTKLLLPMMGMMLIIFAVLMMPALSNLG